GLAAVERRGRAGAGAGRVARRIGSAVMSTDAGDAVMGREIIAGLERTLWTPGDGVRDLDRVEAVQLLGRFRDPAAEAALQRVLREGMAGIRPAPLGRLLRDTALDTLLRSPMLPRA